MRLHVCSHVCMCGIAILYAYVYKVQASQRTIPLLFKHDFVHGLSCWKPNMLFDLRVID